MKVLIIGFYTKTYMPYIEKYENILAEERIDYDIVCFDRDSSSDATHCGNTFIYSKQMGTSKIKKIIPYFRYINFVKQLIKKNEYQRLIVLTTIPAVFLHRLLCGKYRGEYIFDFRDYSYERIALYRKLVDKIVSLSFATFISSEGFMHYLSDNNKINIVHNISNMQSESHGAKEIDINHIVIGFVGYVRYFDVNSKLIQSVKNDDRYKVIFHGTMYDDCDLKKFAEDESIENTYFFDTYNNYQKPELYDTMTFINSIYSLASKEVAYAIPNRLYDAALYKKPIIVAKNTFLEEVVLRYKLGFSIDINHEDIKQAIQSYIETYSPEQFTQYCEKFLRDIKKDEKNFNAIVRQFTK